MSLKGIKLVTFDATNTLLKFRIPPWQFYANVVKEHGYKGDGGDLKHGMLNNYKNMWKTYPNFGRDTINWHNWWKKVVKGTLEGKLPKNAKIDKIADQLIQDFATSTCWCLADGSQNLLKILRSRGIEIGIISNFDPRLHEIIENLKIESYFEFIVTSYEAGFTKPDPRIFKIALNKCKKTLEPSQSLHIGDDLVKDYDGARAAGWHALLINERLKKETSPINKHVFIDLNQLVLALGECTHTI